MLIRSLALENNKSKIIQIKSLHEIKEKNYYQYENNIFGIDFSTNSSVILYGKDNKQDNYIGCMINNPNITLYKLEDATMKSQLNEHSYIYVFIREDLSPSQRIVQSCHALLEASRLFSFNEHPSIIVLKTKNEKALLKVIEYLKLHNIEHKEFKEPDIGYELTAISTILVTEEQRHIFRKYQLI